MLVDKRTQEKITRALASALERTGMKFQAAVLIVQVEDASSKSGSTVMASSTGGPERVAAMVYGHLRRLIAEPVTVTPWNQPDPNVVPPKVN